MTRSLLILLLIVVARAGCTPEMAENELPAQPATATRVRITADERQRVVDAVVVNLKEHYFDKAVAQTIAEALLSREKVGEKDAPTNAELFAELLTKQIRDVSHDMHLEVIYSEEPIPARRPEPSPGERARFRKRIEDQNCLIEKAEVLARNIGYLKLNWFPDPAICEQRMRAAMASLNNASAIIFDLRDNRGGEPRMVALVAAYLFDHPEYWFNPREAPSENSFTRSPVAGSNLADKPVYILTSHTTLSGAEQFTYDLKMLKRATIVGETSGGGAHAGVFHRIDDHFGIAIPEEKAVNPYGPSDWESVGVEPDVKVAAADALDAALKLARGAEDKR